LDISRSTSGTRLSSSYLATSCLAQITGPLFLFVFFEKKKTNRKGGFDLAVFLQVIHGAKTRFNVGHSTQRVAKPLTEQPFSYQIVFSAVKVIQAKKSNQKGNGSDTADQAASHVALDQRCSPAPRDCVASTS
jgi:hypothetical protein